MVDGKYVSLLDAASNEIMRASGNLATRPQCSACEIGAILRVLSVIDIPLEDRQAFVAKWRELPSWLQSSGNTVFAVLAERYLKELLE